MPAKLDYRVCTNCLYLHPETYFDNFIQICYICTNQLKKEGK